MIRHVVCLTFRDGTPDDAVDALAAALRELPRVSPEIRSYAVGADVGLAHGNADLAIVAEFDDVDAWRRYRDHPEHVRVIHELVRPIVEHRAAVQFEV